MPPAPLLIACDESGYEGEKLIGTTTDVFAHASVLLDAGPAADCMLELRHRIRSPATEYKANHLLREKHRAVLRWLLGPSSPVHGRAHVHLIDKAFYVFGKITAVLLDESQVSRQTILTWYQEGSLVFGGELWCAFLEAANNLMRVKERGASVAAFHRIVETMGEVAAGAELPRLLRGSGSRAEDFRKRLIDSPELTHTLDPLVPAIVRAVEHWSAGTSPVTVLHDRQKTLSEARIAHLGRLLGDRLAGLGFGPSSVDPRIQLADVVAGAVRRIAEDELHGRGDPTLTRLLPPFVDPSSLWADDRTRPLLHSREGPARSR